MKQTLDPKLILADSSNEINGFEGPKVCRCSPIRLLNKNGPPTPGEPFKARKPFGFHPLELKIRPRGFLDTLMPNLALKVNYVHKNYHFLLITGFSKIRFGGDFRSSIIFSNQPGQSFWEAPPNGALYYSH